MLYNENSRVKIPAILHFCRLGFEYLSLGKAKWDNSTNIFTDIFKENILRLNPSLNQTDVNMILDELIISLDNQDLGRSFYDKITSTSGNTIIDFENFSINALHVVTELPCINGDEEFRPDITLLINGLPLVFIEVKKPNNLDGIQAEYKRIQSRFSNKKFRKFINITQLMLFSNNMEYDDSGFQPLQGVFYATPSYSNVKFNFFREEGKFDLQALLRPITEDLEKEVLSDNGLISILHSPEFNTNKDPESPTHSVCTSMFQPERLSFLLQFGIAYVDGQNGIEKHIMRYPQIFATKAIERKLEEGVKKGIIWHTQGSGKTALTFYNVKHLTNYFTEKAVVPKFYFIVDRLDLLIQAGREFKSRGLIVHKINSRDSFVKDLKTTTAIHNASGKPEITVVNIQKFKDDTDVINRKDYNISIQRIYFLDEVHRSIIPKVVSWQI
jgi:type I restriction enzyme R subunit